MNRAEHSIRLRRRTGVALGCAVALALTGPLAAAAQAQARSATPTPTPTWPAPGAGAAKSKVLSVRLVQRPLVIIEHDVEAGPGTSFTLGADVLFATGQDSLSTSADQALQTLSDQIRTSGVTGRAAVVGHTDDVGGDADNLALSNRRATTVAARLNALLTGRGITLAAVGKGETQPLVPNKDDASRARNRRVSVVFAGVKPARPDPADIAVSGNTPAPAADGPAPEGSIAGTTTSVTTGVGTSYQKTFRVRLDVTKVTHRGSMLLVETSVQVLSGGNLPGYRQLFTGHFTWTDRHRMSLYDRSTGQELPVVIDGTGEPLRSPLEYELKPGIPRTDWFLFPTPSGPGPLQLYVPAFGVLTVPLS